MVAAIEAQAAQKIADVSGTAAIESAAGALSRAFGAEVQAEDWVRDTVTPVWFAQVGRSLVREALASPLSGCATA